MYTESLHVLHANSVYITEFVQTLTQKKKQAQAF